MTDKKQVSQRDLATRANVSVAAVSKALRDMPDISEDTRMRIKKMAVDMGYTVNVAARSLAMRRTMAIGILVPFAEIPTSVARIRGTQAEATKRGYSAMVAFSEGTPEDELRSLDLLAGRVDGVVVSAMHASRALTGRLRQLPIPVVCMNEPLRGVQVDYVGSDDVRGGRLAAAHLVAAGHRRLAYLGCAGVTPSDKAILSGFRQRLGKSDIELSKGSTLFDNVDPESTVVRVDALLDRRNRPTALFCRSDTVAIWAMTRLRERGIRVPEGMAVIGYNDIPFARMTEVPLTSIHQPSTDIGRTAAAYLLDRITHSGGRTRKVRRKIFPVKLVAREST